MGIQASPKDTAKVIAAVTFMLAPSSLFAGGYGTAGVEDATVGQQTAQGEIWCQRMETNVPEDLYRQMDCGPGRAGVAASAVVPARVTTREQRGLRGIFSNLRHVPQGRSNDSDGPGTRVSTVGGGGSGPNPSPSPSPTPPTTTASTDKWDRLNELGVTRENFDGQSQSLRDQVVDYVKENGGGGDWSGFSPNQ